MKHNIVHFELRRNVLAEEHRAAQRGTLVLRRELLRRCGVGDLHSGVRSRTSVRLLGLPAVLSSLPQGCSGGSQVDLGTIVRHKRKARDPVFAR